MRSRDVVIVEDDKDIRNVVSELLTFEGYCVHEAGDGKRGLEILTHIKEPCLILLDLMMPVMNGWEFISVKKKQREIAKIPVIILTAGSPAEINGEVAGIIRKPFQFSELLEVVKKYCHPG